MLFFLSEYRIKILMFEVFYIKNKVPRQTRVRYINCEYMRDVVIILWAVVVTCYVPIKYCV